MKLHCSCQVIDAKSATPLRSDRSLNVSTLNRIPNDIAWSHKVFTATGYDPCSSDVEELHHHRERGA